jgi:hypothetical protein
MSQNSLPWAVAMAQKSPGPVRAEARECGVVGRLGKATVIGHGIRMCYKHQMAQEKFACSNACVCGCNPNISTSTAIRVLRRP